MGRTKVRLALAVATLMAIAIPALAAELHEPHRDTKCPAGQIGTWHFVNNQTGGATEGWLVVDFGTTIVVQTPDQVNRNVMHWWVRDVGNELVNAWTFSEAVTAANYGGGDPLDGRLVLSYYECKAPPK